MVGVESEREQDIEDTEILKLTLDKQHQRLINEFIESESDKSLSKKSRQQTVYKMIEYAHIARRLCKMETEDPLIFEMMKETKNSTKVHFIDFLYNECNLRELAAIKQACDDIINIKLLYSHINKKEF